MKKLDPFILGILVFLVLILLGGTVLAFQLTGKPMQAYSSSDRDKPKVEISNTYQDLGPMTLSDIKSADFTISNMGNKPLQISNISTSCDCTFAQVTIDDQKSPSFSMHANPSWTGEIQPGKQAVLTAIYEPAKMPVSGEVERTVHLKTNDPQYSDLAFTVKATVQ